MKRDKSICSLISVHSDGWSDYYYDDYDSINDVLNEFDHTCASSGDLWWSLFECLLEMMKHFITQPKRFFVTTTQNLYSAFYGNTRPDDNGSAWRSPSCLSPWSPHSFNFQLLSRQTYYVSVCKVYCLCAGVRMNSWSPGWSLISTDQKSSTLLGSNAVKISTKIFHKISTIFTKHSMHGNNLK